MECKIMIAINNINELMYYFKINLELLAIR